MEFKLFNKERDKKFLKKVCSVIVVIAALLVFFVVVADFFWEPYDDEEYEDEYNLGCNVAGVELHGYLDISVYEEGDVSSDDIVWVIENAESDENIKAIILDIDSTGGDPVAAEEVANALLRVTKPTVALIRSYGLSAAYFGATGADIIFASVGSDIGSIGVSMSYLDNVEQNKQDGLTYNQLSSGKFKDAGNPDKLLTYEERQLMMRDVAILHENFVKAVAENRGLNIEKVRALADGSSMLGEMALESGLIDRIGDLYDVRQYIEDIIDEEPVVCWE